MQQDTTCVFPLASARPSYAYSSGVVITDVAPNHLHEFLFAGEALAVIAFPLQNAPESFHRPIVNAVGYTGHTLCHSSLYEFVVERSACVLEASITVEQGGVF